MATGGAIMAPSAMALLRNGLPRARRARAFGTFGAVMGLSAALGPLIGGELTARFAWPAVFVVNAVPLGLSVLLGAGAPTPPPLAKRPTLDLAGTGLLSLSLLLFIVGLKARGGEAFLALGGVEIAGVDERAGSAVVVFGEITHGAGRAAGASRRITRCTGSSRRVSGLVPTSRSVL